MGDGRRARRALSWALALAGLSACSLQPSIEVADEAVSIHDEVFLTLSFERMEEPPPSFGLGHVSADVHADAIYLQHGRELLIIARDGGAHRSIWLDEIRELLAVPDRDEVLVWLERGSGARPTSRVFAAHTAAPEQPWLLFDYNRVEAVYDPIVVGDRVALLTERGIVHAPLEGGAPSVLSLEHSVVAMRKLPLTDQAGQLLWLGYEDGHTFVLSSGADFEGVTVEYESSDPEIELRDAARVGDSLVLALRDSHAANESLVVMRRDAEGHMLELWREGFPEHDLSVLSDGEHGWVFSNGRLWQLGPDSHARVRSFVPGASGGPLALAIDDGLLIWTTAHRGEHRHHASAALGLAEPLTRPLPPRPAPGWVERGAKDDVWSGLTTAEVGEAYGVGGLGLGLGGDRAPKPGPAQPIPRVRQGKVTVDGPLDSDMVRRIMRAHLNEVRSCYREGLAEDPGLSGAVELEFVIDADGRVQKTKDVSAEELSDPKVHRCIGRAIRRWKFPKPRDHKRVKVTVPFNLSPS